MNTLGKLSDSLNTLAKWICFICGGGMVFIIFLGVFYRYVLNSSLIWYEEIPRYLMIWLAFVGGSIALKNKELISFEFLNNLIPKKVSRYLNLLIDVFSFVFLIVFIVVGFTTIDVFLESTSPATNISLFWPALGLLVGGFIMIVHYLNFILLKLYKQEN